MKNEVYMSGTGNDFICSSYERDLSQIEIISIVGDSLLPIDGVIFIEQINSSNIRWLFKRELAVSILNGIVLSVLVAAITYAWLQDLALALLISCALVINLISSVIAGILVPLILRKFKQDPAIGGSVIVTTVTDVVGFFSFLGLAALYLI